MTSRHLNAEGTTLLPPFSSFLGLRGPWQLKNPSKQASDTPAEAAIHA
jgi:hypothetical protein